MLLPIFSSLALFGFSLAEASPLSARHTVQSLNNDAIAALTAVSSSGFTAKRDGCTVSNAYVRRDWSAFNDTEKINYSSAMKCLMSAPSKQSLDPAFVAPGAKTRYDDFVAVHINQTTTIHGTASTMYRPCCDGANIRVQGSFLTWHRYFLYAFETALRDECNYTGYQPYWNWLENSNVTELPMFDGSATSMSGDGVYRKHNGTTSVGTLHQPSGNGGGCIFDGPFKDMVVNLGPIAPGMDGLEAVNGSYLQYNPHCLSRDLSVWAAENWLTLDNVLNITVGDASGSVDLFQKTLQGQFDANFLGLHTAGHSVMGGTSSDLYASPVDPVFWLHHGMIDRVYWLWQSLHSEQADTVAGTITVLNSPPSRNTSVEDLVQLGPLKQEDRPIKELLSTLGGTPFCYIYL